jgi:hypothetical protein
LTWVVFPTSHAEHFQTPPVAILFCSFRAADGRWLKKSTKSTDRKAALKFCMALETAAGAARQGVLSAAQARKLLWEMVAFSSGEHLEFHSVSGWFTEWLANKAGGIGEKALERYRQVFRDFLTHLGKQTRKRAAGLGIARRRHSLPRQDSTRRETNKMVLHPGNATPIGT